MTGQRAVRAITGILLRDEPLAGQVCMEQGAK